jgi:DNA-binding LacI/PurR family transcriptional regulator
MRDASRDGGVSGRPRLQDVARVAGVSHQTVSRVVNSRPVVADKTRARVLAAVAQLGYQPNSAARTLATGRSHTLGVLIVGGTFYGPMSTLLGIEGAARARDYRVLVSIENDAASSKTALAGLERQGVDGLIVIASPRSIEASIPGHGIDLPLVMVGGGPHGASATIRVDHQAGARAATSYLIGLGHETVWHVSGPAGWCETDQRIEGWRESLLDAGREVPPLLHGDWSAGSGYEVGRLLACIPEARAVFAANDQMALGILRALGEAGRAVPEDVSVVGFDDIPESGYWAPPLTTIRQAFDVVGRLSVELLFDRAQSTSASSDVSLRPELVVRESATRPGG